MGSFANPFLEQVRALFGKLQFLLKGEVQQFGGISGVGGRRQGAYLEPRPEHPLGAGGGGAELAHFGGGHHWGEQNDPKNTLFFERPARAGAVEI